MTPREHLIAEGLREDQITFENDIHLATTIGLYSYRIVDGYPFLTHFLVYPEKRSISSLARLYLTFKLDIASKGFRYFIASVMPERVHFKTLLAKLGATEPYMTDAAGTEFYLVGV
jgi:uncharacterized membrane protein